ncbi:hypothetical protein [Coleofasciculus chthonoplastes]|uniref:hypothetical protein n=1 Tax=Coleofasciculus chthonoplastes TaxID=64178 RepID=UPI0040635F22
MITSSVAIANRSVYPTPGWENKATPAQSVSGKTPACIAQTVEFYAITVSIAVSAAR